MSVANAQFANFSAFITSLTPLEEPATWDIMEQGTLHLHVVADWYNITNPGNGSEVIASWYTRVYCYSNQSDYYDNSTCGIPGPTIIFHPNNETQEVVLHNHLRGIGKHVAQSGNGLQNYKDPDTVNIHVHGLHVSPHVDNIVDLFIDPVCPENITNGTEFVCYENNIVGNQSYPYVIPITHYPGTHWYHAHWHGSTTLHVNGGMYGVIKMEAYEGIENITMYEPQLINDSYDHIIAASFVWLNSADSCSTLLAGVEVNCTKGGRLGTKPDTTPDYLAEYIHYQGIKPFNFALEGWCWVNCKLKDKNPQQYRYTQVKADSVVFTPLGEWDGSDFQRGFLINGQARPHLAIKTGEWHRLRIVNTNMAYLIWQLNSFSDDSTDLSDAITPDVCQQWLISNDGIYFADGPRLVNFPPYNGSFVIPPGGRADIMLICGEQGAYTVLASNNSRSNGNSNNLFANAPLPSWSSRVLTITAEGDSVSMGNKTKCADWDTPELPCKFVPYSYSPYLENTTNNTNVTSACQTPHGPNVGPLSINQCNIVLQRQTITAGQVTVNHIKFQSDTPLLNISTQTTHEWLVTSNFHQFHQHTWPFQMQRNVLNGWLAQKGDWRDVVGAPGSFTARSNLLLFNSGKLVQHCHFVPHEDHGLMAYHELMDPNSFDNSPIVPTNMSANTDFNTSYQAPNSSQLVSDCISFSALSSVDIADSDTRIYMYFKQFIINETCFFGYLPIVVFRPGGTSNAFIGFGLFGSYQDDWTDATIDGDGLVFTLSAGDPDSSGAYDLATLTLAEVTFTNYTFTSKRTTPGKCQDVPFYWTDSNTNREIRAWYCVRPRTKKYPKNGIDVYKHLNKSDPFGYAFTYGEGQFHKRTQYSSSGTCGMQFYIGQEESNFEDLETNSITDDVGQPYFRCFQLGTIVGTNGQQVNFNITTVDLTNLSFANSTFIEFSGYDLSDIKKESQPSSTTPGMTQATDSTTTEPMTTESTDGGVSYRTQLTMWVIVSAVYSVRF